MSLIVRSLAETEISTDCGTDRKYAASGTDKTRKERIVRLRGASLRITRTWKCACSPAVQPSATLTNERVMHDCPTPTGRGSEPHRCSTAETDYRAILKQLSGRPVGGFSPHVHGRLAKSVFFHSMYPSIGYQIFICRLPPLAFPRRRLTKRVIIVSLLGLTEFKFRPSVCSVCNYTFRKATSKFTIFKKLLQ